jgi:hypothetical protein
MICAIGLWRGLEVNSPTRLLKSNLQQKAPPFFNALTLKKIFSFSPFRRKLAAETVESSP